MQALIWFIALIIVAIFTSDGCTGKEEVVYPDCYVYDVDNANNMSIAICPTVCSANDVIYYCDSNVIYRFENGEVEALFSIENRILGMAYTSHGLYYVLQEPEEETLYKYDWETHEKIKLYSGIEVARLASHDDRVFFRSTVYIYSVENEEITRVDDFIKRSEDDLCTWEEYSISSVDDSGYEKIGVITCVNDGWQYFYLEPCYITTNNKQIKIDNTTISFDKTEIDYSEKIEEEYIGAAVSWEHVGIEGDNLYILYQYGGGPSLYSTNSESYLRKKDAIYAIDVNTQEISLVYDTEDNSEQIAGFSVERNEMYLVRQDGVYRCDMQGNNEVKIVDGFYKTLVFEDCNDYFFIYDASDWSRWKLLLID